MYDRSTVFWQLLLSCARLLPPLKAKGGARGNIRMALFWGAHQRFYRQMLMAAKVGGWLARGGVAGGGGWLAGWEYTDT